MKNGRMVFKDRSTFEQYSASIGQVPANTLVEAHLDATEKKLHFYSLRSVFHPLAGTPVGRVADACAVDDDYLASMLSPEGIVQIGEWIYKVDVCNEKVYALPVAEEAYVGELTEKTPSHEKIQVFSTDDEVLDLIEAGETGDPTARIALFCGESGIPDNIDDKGFVSYGDGYQLDCKVVYQKAGIYFSLQAKVKNQVKVLLVWDGIPGTLTLNSFDQYEPKCKSGSQPRYDYLATFDRELSRRAYSNTRGLHKAWYRVQFQNQDAGVTTRVFEVKYRY